VRWINYLIAHSCIETNIMLQDNTTLNEKPTFPLRKNRLFVIEVRKGSKYSMAAVGVWAIRESGIRNRIKILIYLPVFLQDYIQLLVF